MSTWAAWLTETQWAWEDEPNVVVVMAHLLETAAVAPRRYKYESLRRGDFFTTHCALGEVCDLTVKQVRLILTKLEGTGEIKLIRRSRGLVIRVLKYEDWQDIKSSFCKEVPTSCLSATENDTATIGQVTGVAETESRQDKGNPEFNKGQSHIIRNSLFRRTKTPPLIPPTGRSAENSNQDFGKERNNFQKSTKASCAAKPELPKLVQGNSQKNKNRDLHQKKKQNTSGSSAPASSVAKKRLQKFVKAERVFLTPGVIDKLANEPIEYIGLVYEAAVEKRDQKSNVLFPHAVARYRADLGLTPRKETIDRLKRVLNPPPKAQPRPIPKTDCPYCSGSGSVYGNECECIGGKHRTADEITQLKHEQNRLLEQIRQQLAFTGEQK